MVSRAGETGSTVCMFKGSNDDSEISKESIRVLISGLWPWKSAQKAESPARECVTTHLTNAVASKMDDAQVGARQHAMPSCR